MSLPFALSADHVYKVRIERIDGVSVSPAVRYRVAPGEHIVTLSPLVDVEWSPDLVENPHRLQHNKNFRLVVEQGKTYQLAVKIDVQAVAESQLDQSYWSPFVYAVLQD